MGLPWIRLDTAMPDHPKFLALVEGHRDGRATAWVHVCGMAYAGKHGTDGFLPRECLTRLHGKPADAERLVLAGLWRAVAGGWEINGWDEYQISDAEAQERKRRAKDAAAVRWHGRKDA